MHSIKRKPTHPGEILEQEFLMPLGLSQSLLARHIGCDVKVINRIINERSGISAEMALKLGGAFRTTPEFWLNAQQAVDLYNAGRLATRIPSAITKRKLQGTRAA